MADDVKKSSAAPAQKSEPAPKEKSPSGDVSKPEATAKDKSTSGDSPKSEGGKSEGGKEAAGAPASYSRGEGQKPVTKAYKENWNAIFGNKKKKR